MWVLKQKWKGDYSCRYWIADALCSNISSALLHSDNREGVTGSMDTTIDTQSWKNLTYAEKNHQLFLRQKALLAGFLEHGAISQAQHDKSLHDLIEKMGEKE